MFAVRQIAVAWSLAAAPSGSLPSAHLFAPITSLTVERLDVGAKAITAEPLRSRLEMVLKRGGTRELAGKSTLCPTVIADAELPTLHCTSSRFSATLDPKSGSITLVELRGLPWRADDDGPPRWAYDPRALDKELSCPGTSPVAIAECDYQAGRIDQAFEEFTALLGSPHRGFASLRLGDISLAHEDTERALEAYNQAAKQASPVASLALLRRCELIDDCTPQLLNPATYPIELRPEARLRIAREHAFHHEWGDVVTLLGDVSAEPTAAAANRAEEARLQRRLLVGALGVPPNTTPDDDDRLTHALELYLNDPDRLTGRFAEQLTDAAAEAAAHLGTPRFGAHILAAVFPQVAPRHRAGHLLRTAELYLDDDDAAHAEAIFEFAHTRLASSELRQLRWQRVGQRLHQYGAAARADEALAERLKRQVQLSNEVTEAMRISANARKNSEGTP